MKNWSRKFTNTGGSKYRGPRLPSSFLDRIHEEEQKSKPDGYIRFSSHKSQNKRKPQTRLDRFVNEIEESSGTLNPKRARANWNSRDKSDSNDDLTDYYPSQFEVTTKIFAKRKEHSQPLQRGKHRVIGKEEDERQTDCNFSELKKITKPTRHSPLASRNSEMDALLSVPNKPLNDAHRDIVQLDAQIKSLERKLGIHKSKKDHKAKLIADSEDDDLFGIKIC